MASEFLNTHVRNIEISRFLSRPRHNSASSPIIEIHNQGAQKRMNASRALILITLSLTLSACGGSDPGPLKGSWRMGGPVPTTVHFRSGETVALGIIEKVSYDKKGQDVIVNYQSGLMTGTAMRYTVTGPNTARSELGTLQRLE